MRLFNDHRMFKGLFRVERIVKKIISACCPLNWDSCVVCRHIEQKWTELLRELEERLDQEKETGQKEVGTYCTNCKLYLYHGENSRGHFKTQRSSLNTFPSPAIGPSTSGRPEVAPPPLFSLILLCASQSRQLVAIGQKKASSHSFATIESTCEEKNEIHGQNLGAT